ncbi:hypothetical protein [Rhizobium oryziradicis]|uniref:hypothetical protein n=1 Tax=Rhizobium oryziradicis TaxID=1867956 RepID=UPI0015881625|nr:hypothetical protein [Rhizobium oryziradicis]
MRTMLLQTIRSTGELFAGRKMPHAVLANAAMKDLEHWWRQAVTFLLDQCVGRFV